MHTEGNSHEGTYPHMEEHTYGGTYTQKNIHTEEHTHGGDIDTEQGYTRRRHTLYRLCRSSEPFTRRPNY